MNFASNLTMKRREAGLTQQELADRTELEQSHISHFETGRRQPTLLVLVNLSNALNCTTDSLVKP